MVKVRDVLIDHFGVWRRLALPALRPGVNVVQIPHSEAADQLFEALTGAFFGFDTAKFVAAATPAWTDWQPPDRDRTQEQLAEVRLTLELNGRDAPPAAAGRPRPAAKAVSTGPLRLILQRSASRDRGTGRVQQRFQLQQPELPDQSLDSHPTAVRERWWQICQQSAPRVQRFYWSANPFDLRIERQMASNPLLPASTHHGPSTDADSHASSKVVRDVMQQLERLNRDRQHLARILDQLDQLRQEIARLQLRQAEMHGSQVRSERRVRRLAARIRRDRRRLAHLRAAGQLTPLLRQQAALQARLGRPAATNPPTAELMSQLQTADQRVRGLEQSLAALPQADMQIRAKGKQLEELRDRLSQAQRLAEQASALDQLQRQLREAAEHQRRKQQASRRKQQAARRSWRLQQLQQARRTLLSLRTPARRLKEIRAQLQHWSTDEAQAAWASSTLLPPPPSPLAATAAPSPAAMPRASSNPAAPDPDRGGTRAPERQRRTELEEAIEQLRQRLDLDIELKRLQRQMAEQQTQLELLQQAAGTPVQALWLLIGFLALGILVVLAGLLLPASSRWQVPLVTIGVVLALASALLKVSYDRTSSRQLENAHYHLQALETAIVENRRQAQRLDETYPPSGQQRDEQLQRLLDRLHELDESLVQTGTAADTSHPAPRPTQVATQPPHITITPAQRWEARGKQLRRQLRQAAAHWRKELQELQLPTHLTPRKLFVLMREHASQPPHPSALPADTIEPDVVPHPRQQFQQSCAEWISAVASLLQVDRPEDPPAALRWKPLWQQLQRRQERWQRAAGKLGQRQAAQDNQRQALESELELARLHQQSLLALAGVDSAEELQQRWNVEQRRAKVRDRLAELDAEIERARTPLRLPRQLRQAASSRDWSTQIRRHTRTILRRLRADRQRHQRLQQQIQSQAGANDTAPLHRLLDRQGRLELQAQQLTDKLQAAESARQALSHLADRPASAEPPPSEPVANPTFAFFVQALTNGRYRTVHRLPPDRLELEQTGGVRVTPDQLAPEDRQRLALALHLAQAWLLSNAHPKLPLIWRLPAESARYVDPRLARLLRGFARRSGCQVVLIVSDPATAARLAECGLSVMEVQRETVVPPSATVAMTEPTATGQPPDVLQLAAETLREAEETLVVPELELSPPLPAQRSHAVGPRVPPAEAEPSDRSSPSDQSTAADHWWAPGALSPPPRRAPQPGAADRTPAAGEPRHTPVSDSITAAPSWLTPVEYQLDPAIQSEPPSGATPSDEQTRRPQPRHPLSLLDSLWAEQQAERQKPSPPDQAAEGAPDWFPD